MQSLTNKIGTGPISATDKLPNALDIKRILICRPNHRLGNLLLLTPLLQEVMEVFPQSEIDLFVKGNIAPSIFKNYKNIHEIIQLPKKPLKDLKGYIQGWLHIKTNRYDLAINAVPNSSSGRLSTQFANARYKFFGDNVKDVRWEGDDKHIAKYPVYNFRSYLGAMGYAVTSKSIPPLNLNLTPLEIERGKAILKSIIQNDRKTISIFTYATGDKCYSKSWWENFYERLKHEFADYNIIEVLPFEKISMISFKAPTYYGTDIRDIGAVVANSELFVGADSGIMHLASASQTPTIGLFSITDSEVYYPYHNRSTAINTNYVNLDQCMEILQTILHNSTHVEQIRPTKPDPTANPSVVRSTSGQ